MANATVGIAMGAVALMADDLDRLPFVIGLSRQTTRVIRQNLWVSSAWWRCWFRQRC